MDLSIRSSGDALEDLSLREASRLYAVELTTLQNLVRRGRLAAYKTRGPWGREWRVTRSALEAKGYTPRPAGVAGENDERVARLERELAGVRRAAAAERRRAEEADRRLGAALLESGRLRAALAVEDGDAQGADLPSVDMDEFRDVLIDLRAGRHHGGRD